MSVKTKPDLNITSFNPTVKTLFGPGPSDVHQRVLDAMRKPTIGHLDPEFIGLMDEIKALLQYVFQTENKLTMPVSGPGSAGMEMCFVNLLEPGDKAIVCKNGVFGARMEENVIRCGAKAVTIDDEWGDPVDPGKVEKALKENPDAKLVAFVHAETSTGALSDAKAIAQLAHQHDALVIMDAVTSLGGLPVLLDEWGIDAVYSGSQKCLSCTPGLSPVSFNDRALDIIHNRKTKVQSWFLDIGLVTQYWGEGSKRSYHHTAPINALYGLHEALLMVYEEGLENVWERHQQMHEYLAGELEKMGFTFVVEKGSRLPDLNSVYIPEGVDDAATRQKLLDAGYEIGAGLGPLAGKIWRIGLMGNSARKEKVDAFLKTLRGVL